ncbi:MAG: hypothetical protein ACK5SI_11495 [Planctomycetia bacterium]
MLRAVQELLLDCLLADDPVRALKELLPRAAGLSDEERAWLAGIDADGLAITALIVKKLRFERLTLAHGEMQSLFDLDPARFMQLYRDYTAAVPPTGYFPSQEGDLFRDWHRR